MYNTIIFLYEHDIILYYHHLNRFSRSNEVRMWVIRPHVKRGKQSYHESVGNVNHKLYFLCRNVLFTTLHHLFFLNANSKEETCLFNSQEKP